MKFSGYTSLSSVPVNEISAQQKALLSSLWVESVEEFSALMAVTDVSERCRGVNVDNLRKTAFTVFGSVPDDRLAHWRKTAPGGALGCAVKEETLQLFAACGRLSEPGSVTMQASNAPLPASVRLMDKLLPVRDQGSRGTCVAFATTALREFLAACSDQLSEQFLYWACKHNDGIPECEGTYVATAMSVLETKGECREQIWPYNPSPIAGNEAQDPLPDGAETDALRFKTTGTRSVSRNNVNHYKHVLAGTDGNAPSPVVIGALVFDSWLCSPATAHTGKITMPLPGEQPVGGHAMLVVGYQDDTSVPGGGYFIVRNSWAETWASHSPEAAGHALMPYAYVEAYVCDAFSAFCDRSGDKNADIERTETLVEKVQSETRHEEKGARNSVDEKYIAVLSEAQRDKNHKRLEKGTRVIRHPESPELFLEDTPQNRKAFINAGYAWDNATLTSLWFPDSVEWKRTASSNFAVEHAYCRHFMDALDKNLKEAVGEPVPDFKLPWWTGCLAWHPTVKSVEMVADLSDAFVRQICSEGGAPENAEIPDAWLRELKKVNVLRIYRVRGFQYCSCVIVCYGTSLRFKRGAQPEIVAADSSYEALASHVFKEWVEKSGDKPRAVFYAMGAGQWNAEKVTDSSITFPVLSHPCGDSWKTLCPPNFNTRRYLRWFIDRLTPITSAQRVSAIEKAVRGLLDDGHAGSIRVERIAKMTGYRRSAVAKAFEAMQESGHYECYRIEKELAVRKSASGGQGITFYKEKNPVIRYHVCMLICTFISILGWFVINYLSSGIFNWAYLLIVFVFVYFGRCLEAGIKRNQKELT
jgi:C1A family cysteine protease